MTDAATRTRPGRMGRPLRQMSFRSRLSTLVALAVGLTVALAALASYFVVRHQLFAQVDSSLRGDIARAVTADGNINPDVARNIIRSSGGFAQTIDGQGNVVVTGPFSNTFVRPTAAEIAAVGGGGGGATVDTNVVQGVTFRVITQPAVLGTQQVGVQIGLPIGDVFHTLHALRLILWLVTMGGIGLGVALGYGIGRSTIRPVTRLTAAAEHVAATQDLEATIEVGSEDELGRLAGAFNAMLSALAASRQQQAQLISDAGHELRTPLTSLRTNIEVLMKMRDLPETDRAELTADVQAQLEELTNLIGDLVDMARHEERQPEPIEVRLDSIVERAAERARRRAPGLTFETHLTPGSVRAQPALLERAVLNVLDNAAKWSPPGGTVEVWLQRGAVWTLDVHDHGPGIAPEDLPHVFDRFYRAASARSMPGSGLGLAIVRQVMGSHGGTVTAWVPPEGGTVVHVELPIVSEMEADGPPPDTATPPPPPAAGPVPADAKVDAR